MIMFPLNKWQRGREELILNQFPTSERELTMLELHRLTRIPIGVLSSALERLTQSGRLVARMGEKTAHGTHHSLYKIKRSASVE
jgi:hypothetical protein